MDTSVLEQTSALPLILSLHASLKRFLTRLLSPPTFALVLVEQVLLRGWIRLQW